MKKKTLSLSLSESRRIVRSRWLLLLILSLVLVLAACGGDETSQTQEPATVAVATDSAPAEATSEEPAEPAPTAIPPTDVPAAEPTAEPEVAPTEVDTPVTAGGGCDNPYFPVIEGRVMRYINTVPDMEASEYTITYSDITESSFVSTIDFGDDEPITQEWQCLDGGLLSPQSLNLPGAEGLSVEYSDVEGLTLPPADQMEVGGSWITRYSATATMSDEDSGSMTMVQETELTNTVTAIESVTVPAGTYPDALRVETTGAINMTMTIGDTSAPATVIDMTYTSWYVEGIGLVKQEFPDLFGGEGESSSLTELVAIE